MFTRGWRVRKLVGWAGVAVAASCAASGVWAQSQGLTAQQLTAPPQRTSWMSKVPFVGPSRPKTKAFESGGASAANPSRPGASKSEQKMDLMALARLNERRGQTDLAKQMYERELQANPHNGAAHHRLAVIACQEEQWSKANQHFEQARQLLPQNAELLSDLGYALYLQHRLEDAESYLRAAVAADPRQLAARNNLGIVLGVQGKFDESFAEFKRAGTLAEAHTNMAYVHSQLGDVDQAMSHLHQALAIDPNQRTAAVALVQLHEIKKRFDKSPRAEKSLVRDEQPQSGPDARTLASTFEQQTANARAVASRTEQPPKKADDLIESVVDAAPRSAARPAAMPELAHSASKPGKPPERSASERSGWPLMPLAAASAPPPRTAPEGKERAGEGPTSQPPGPAQPNEDFLMPPKALPLAVAAERSRGPAPSSGPAAAEKLHTKSRPDEPTVAAARPSLAEALVGEPQSVRPNRDVAAAGAKFAEAPIETSPAPRAGTVRDRAVTAIGVEAEPKKIAHAAAGERSTVKAPTPAASRGRPAAERVVVQPASASTGQGRDVTPPQGPRRIVRPLPVAAQPAASAEPHLAPIVSPSEAMQAIRHKQREKEAAQTAKTTVIRPASADKPAAPSGSTLESAPSTLISPTLIGSEGSFRGAKGDHRTASGPLAEREATIPTAPKARVPTAPPLTLTNPTLIGSEGSFRGAKGDHWPAPGPLAEREATMATALQAKVPTALPQAGVFHTSVPQAADAQPTNMDLPGRMPQIPIPRAEELMPPDALLQQAPTHQLHPAAQTTWSASSQPFRFMTDSSGFDTAHFFNRLTSSEPEATAPPPFPAPLDR